MTVQRVACPGRILPRDRHYATATRWTLTTPLDWLVKALPADVEAGKGDTATRAREGEAAA
jgi:hypothetical protein